MRRLGFWPTPGAVARATLVLALAGAAAGAAQAAASALDLATAEAFIKVCSDAEPDRATEFKSSLNPPYSCPSLDSPEAAGTRQTAEYQGQFDTISSEMVRMPKEQIHTFCESLLEKHC